MMESHCGEEAELWIYFSFGGEVLWSADFLVAYLRLHLL